MIELHFNGKKDPARRAAAERNEEVEGYVFRPWRKTTLTYAIRMPVPFEVDTLEGLHTGKAGDFLALGQHGEMYPIDAEVFHETYERWRQGDPK